MVLTRVWISLLALGTAVGVAYFAMALGLGSGAVLSAPNTKYAIRVGLIYGVILVLIINCLPVRQVRRAWRVSAIVILVAHLLFGLGLMIWTAAMATV